MRREDFCARCLPRIKTQDMLVETAERGSKAGKRKEACSCAGLSGNGITFQQVNLADGAMR